ncbi:MAG: pyrroline-5-carboxylate reductase [Eggerthellaceae bacterium]
MSIDLDVLSSSSARVAVIGGGKMGEAILGGWIKAQSGAAASWSADCFTVVEPDDARREYLESEYGVRCVADVALLEAADMFLLAVKPQVMPAVLPGVAALPGAGGALFVSIAAGLSTAKLESQLPEGSHLVRVMPNVALLVEKGATTLCAGSCATHEELSFVRDLFGCIGDAFVIDEEQMDITCAINGSGPAYAAAMVEALAAAAAQAGLDADLAERLAAQTVYGAGALMVERGQSAEETRIAVSSPGGTTLAALAAMEDGGFSDSLAAGVKAAIVRSKELGA